MADATKHPSINGGRLISDLKTLFSLPRSKRTSVCTYASIFVFIAFSLFLAFTPSSNSSSPLFTNIISSFSSISNSNNASKSSPEIFSNQSFGSHFSSIYSHFFPNSSQPAPNLSPPPKNATRSQSTTAIQSPNSNKQPPTKNQTQNKDLHDKVGVLKPNQSTIGSPKTPQTQNSEPKSSPPTLDKKPPTKNQTQSKDLHDKVGVLKPNQSTIAVPKSPHTGNSEPKASPLSKNTTGYEGLKVTEKGLVSNFSSSPLKKQSNGTNNAAEKQRSEDSVEALMNCDMFDGEWVRDDSYPLYKPGSCSLIDEQFNCFVNGRRDNGYHKLKWKPKGCTLPRLNGSHMLELLRGKRLVFVGDSLNRNMWESLVCILRNSVKDRSKVYEASGRHHFRSEPSYSFVFKDYGCTIEFFVLPFIVQEWEMPEKDGSKKETLRLDRIGSSSDQYKNADVLIFNTGHWWTHEKTSKGKDYYQEGSHVYSELNVLEAFRKALTTWARWVDANINPMKTLVLFRGYSASHFSGGQWNSGGQCDHETEPIKNKTYLSQYPPKMEVLEKVLKGMKTRVAYLNITRMTDYRKDGHPSIYRKHEYSAEEKKSPLMFQDCSHWCLPGVPDTWNEVLYAELLVKQKQKQRQQQQQKKNHR